jgi:hypothetical protein
MKPALPSTFEKDNKRGDLIALMMQAVSTSETCVNFYQTTRRNIPEDSHPHAYISFVLFLAYIP